MLYTSEMEEHLEYKVGDVVTKEYITFTKGGSYDRHPSRTKTKT